MDGITIMKSFVPKDVVELILQYCNNYTIQKLYQSNREIYCFINQTAELDKSIINKHIMGFAKKCFFDYNELNDILLNPSYYIAQVEDLTKNIQSFLTFRFNHSTISHIFKRKKVDYTFENPSQFKIRIVFREKKDEKDICKIFYAKNEKFPIQQFEAQLDSETIAIYPCIMINDIILDFNQELGIMIPRVFDDIDLIQSLVKEIQTLDLEDASLISFYIANLNLDNFEKKSYEFVDLFLDQFNIKITDEYSSLLKEFQNSHSCPMTIKSKGKETFYENHSDLDVDIYQYRNGFSFNVHTFSLFANFDLIFWARSKEDQKYGILGSKRYDPDESGIGCRFSHLHDVNNTW